MKMKTNAMLNAIILANALCTAALCAAPQAERQAPSDADRAPLQMEVVRAPGRVAFRVRLDDDSADAWVAILISDRERAVPLDTDRAPRLDRERAAPLDTDRAPRLDRERAAPRDTDRAPRLDRERAAPLDTDRAPDLLDADAVLAFGRAVAGRFDADFALAIADRAPLTHDSYVQPVAVDRDGRIRIGAIAVVRLQPDQHDGVARTIDDSTVSRTIDDTIIDTDDRYDGPPMAAWVIDAKGIGVEFTVPSNDYALFLDSTRTTENGCDVFLFLEEPGEGQGLLDVVEYHSMSIGVNRQNGNLIRVFVARAPRSNDDSVSAARRQYKLATELHMPQ